MPCAASRPRVLTSLMKTSNPANFCPLRTIPNSAACLMELVVSAPALASPTTFAFRGLRLQQRRREIQRVDRNPDAAEHPAAAGPDERGSDLLKVVAESIIGRQKKPCVVASLDCGGASAVCERVIVIRVMDRDRRACLVGDVRRGGPIEDDDLVFIFGKFNSVA